MASRKGILDQMYVFEYDVGMWTYGSIQVLTERGTGKQKTCKKVPKSELVGTTASVAMAKLQTLKELQHPHISSITNVLEDSDNIYIISEFWPGGDVQDWMERLDEGNWLQEQTCAAYVRQAVLALSHSHAVQCYHRNLQPSHFALTTKLPDAVVKVCDLGLAAILDPESVKLRKNHSPYSSKDVPGTSDPVSNGAADLYSVGAIAHRMLVGSAPAVASGTSSWMRRARSQEEESWSERSPMSRDFVTRLMTTLTASPSAAKALNHPWLKGLTPLSGPTFRADNDGARDLRHKTLCYTLGIILLPVVVPFRDFEQLRVAFQQSDLDRDGFIPRAVAQRILLGRVNIIDAVRPALSIVDVFKTDTIDLAGLSCADLIVREFFAAGPSPAPLIGPFRATDLVPRMMARFFEVFADRRGDKTQAVSAASLKVKLRTATAKDVETHANIRYDDVLSCLPEDGIDQQMLRSQVTQNAGQGTPLGTESCVVPTPSSHAWPLPFSFDVSSFFHSCGSGPSTRREDSPGSIRIF